MQGDGGRLREYQKTSEQDKDAAREAGRKGGLASVAAHRKKKAIQHILGMKLYEKDLDDIELLQSLAEVKGANITVEEAMAIAMVKRALKGDIKAYEAVTKYENGQKAAELANEKQKLEIERMKIELDAYKQALEGRRESGVMIVDDLPNTD